jgi:hypothetical protein
MILCKFINLVKFVGQADRQTFVGQTDDCTDRLTGRWTDRHMHRRTNELMGG